ncbi:hypothetical protein [Phenylobacterium aquaticum]|uniref:hypothetical protein n=1 Tax=Phenylobacterium aquaticum TaxID=1763816 RepID=UPI001F5C7B2A|nr:hypothetical protein [Phenylobacterium aquaticum]MCI3134592.1 hypothetical protein [Phenylobacterium aquaticum]
MSFRTLALALIAVLALSLGAPSARAQVNAAAINAQNAAAVAASMAKDYDTAARLFGGLCGQGFDVACRNQNSSLFNLGVTISSCDVDQPASNCVDRSNRAASAFGQVCGSTAGGADRQVACKQAELARSRAQIWAVADRTDPPPGGCLQVNTANNMVSYACGRDGFAQFCAVEHSAPQVGCAAGLSWSTFNTVSAPSSLVLDGVAPGSADIFWYECYGLLPKWNSDLTRAGAPAFDPKTGWRNVRCYTRNGEPTTPVFRSTLGPGDRGPKGR